MSSAGAWNSIPFVLYKKRKTATFAAFSKFNIVLMIRAKCRRDCSGPYPCTTGTDLHEYEIGSILLPKETPNAYTGETTPIVLGHEFSGIVEEVGKNITEFKKVDRVVVNPVTTRGNHSAEIDRYYEFYSLGLHTDGSFAQYVLTNTENVVRVPEELPYEHETFKKSLHILMNKNI